MPQFKIGDKVRIIDGHFVGLEFVIAVIDASDGYESDPYYENDDQTVGGWWDELELIKGVSEPPVLVESPYRKMPL